MANKLKIALVVSHPIQHFCPQYASIAQHDQVQLKVFFASALGLKKYVDPDFKKEISWGNLHLDQFEHVFLNGDAVLNADKNLDAPTLERALDEFHPDLLIIYGYFQRLQRRAYSWANRHRVKLAYISDSEKMQKRSRVREMIKYPFLRQFFSRIRFFLTVGNGNEAYYRSYGVPDSKVIRMHFPIDITSYERAYSCKDQVRNLTRERYGIGAGEAVLCVVGKLVPWKNQADIIDAMALLEQRQVFMQLFIIGSGETMDLLQKKAMKLTKSKVHFAGFVKPESLPDYYAAADIYVHPAMIEPHSLAISEAIYMGCPVIISDRCGSYGKEDDVQEGRNGYIYPGGNIQKLSEKIKELMERPDIRNEFGKYSNQIAVEFQRISHKGFIDELLRRFTYESKN